MTSGIGNPSAFTPSFYATHLVSLGFCSLLFCQTGDGWTEVAAQITHENVRLADNITARIMFFLNACCLKKSEEIFW
jgi:hypothetical protein